MMSESDKLYDAIYKAADQLDVKLPYQVVGDNRAESALWMLVAEVQKRFRELERMYDQRDADYQKSLRFINAFEENLEVIHRLSDTAMITSNVVEHPDFR